MQALLRIFYAVLLFATLLMTLGPSRWFFISERYGGYAASDPVTDRVQNPFLLPWLLTLWFACAVMMAAGLDTVGFSLINLLLCRYFFIHMRWKGILRGMGAPGFMTYWLAACVFFLEYGLRMDPSGSLRSLALCVFRIDFAAIMLSAGFYKVISGYTRNQGMEYGLVNPWWGYWWRFYRKLPPQHIAFKILNHLAYGTEIVAGLLLLIPSTSSAGAWLVIVSFLFIATQIRLGFLCEMVITAALIYMQPGSAADTIVSSWSTVSLDAVPTATSLTPYLNNALAFLLWAYVSLLPLAHAGLWYNFLLRKTLPAPLQRVLDLYTNFFGIIIWRVFTFDLVNFFANIYVIDKSSKEKLSCARSWRNGFRYRHVGEFVCLASIFTTLRYYPSNRSLFNERLVRYARTIPCLAGSWVLFEYQSIRKLSDRFEFLPVVEYVVDPQQRTVEEKLLDESFSFQSGASPVHETHSPGTYAPLKLIRPAASDKSKFI